MDREIDTVSTFAKFPRRDLAELGASPPCPTEMFLETVAATLSEQLRAPMETG